jgi:SHS2 domain-containing protein
MSPYELFDHTADLGMRVSAPDLGTLFRDAAAGLLAMIVEPATPPGAGAERIELRVEGTRTDWLLFDWLDELLFLFETRRLVLGDFEVRLDGAGLSASARGRPLDAQADRLLHEVKAITYHGLRVERTAEGWVAELIVDI